MHKRLKGAFGALMGAMVAFGTCAGTAHADQELAKWVRLSGDNRYETSAAIIAERFSDNNTVVIASGENYPDALAATGIAGALSCPVVLVRPGYLGDDVHAQLERLHATSCVIVGGTGAVSEWLEEELAEYGITCERIVGLDRQQTSLQAMRYLREKDPRSDTVIVASGYGFADALSAGPYAWASASPVLLADSWGELSDEQVWQVKSDPGIKRVVIVGGVSAVSGTVEEAFGEGYEVVRLGGENRYETSKLVAQWEVSQNLSFDSPVVASGKNFPDALAGAALAGATNSVLVIADSADEVTLDFIRENSAKVSKGYLLGGRRAMPVDDPFGALRLTTADADSQDKRGSGSTYNAGVGLAGNIKVQHLIDFMVKACSEWSLGYDQQDRWNVYDGGECDCASLVYTALWDAGILEEPPFDERVGMCSTVAADLMEAGWTMHSADLTTLRPGDILLNENDHVAVVVSGEGTDAYLAQAAGDENGGYVGGASGDQLSFEEDHGETNIVKAYELWSGWDMILRLE